MCDEMNYKMPRDKITLFRTARGFICALGVSAFVAGYSAQYAPVQAQNFGDGVAAYKGKQYKAARTEFQPLAEAGNADAQYHMGILFALGRGVERDIQQAENWFLKAARQGHTGAQYSVGAIHLQRSDIPQAIHYFKAAAAKGSRSAEYNLGVIYAKGHDVERDLEQAFKWYSLAAAKGHPNAQFNLGVFYRDGLGTGANAHKALEWLTAAARNGSVLAQNNLARMFALGQGVPKDLVLSYMWLETAEPRENGRRNLHNRHRSAGSEQTVRNTRSAKRILAEQMSAGDIQRARALARDWVKTFGDSRR
jgi:TPR repeat protein